MARCQSVLPLCEQIIRLQIGIGELLAFHTAVSEKAQMHNLPMDAAAYHVIEDIQDYNRLAGMKKELNNTSMQVYTVNQICAPRNKAITTLLKLQAFGITDDEILNVYEFLNRSLMTPLTSPCVSSMSIEPVVIIGDLFKHDFVYMKQPDVIIRRTQT